jgi:peptidyl-prolyl cis-trans isomerase SurA
MKRTIFSFIAVFLFIVLAGYSSAGVVFDKVVAVVNNEAITWSELYKAMEFQLAGKLQALTDEQKRDVFKKNEVAFLEDMIDFKLQLQEARRLGIKVTDADVDNAIENIRRKYSMDEEEFKRALEQEGFTLKEYRRMLSEQIMIGRLVEQEVRSKILIDEGDMEGKEEFYRIRQIFFRKPEDGNEDALREKIAAVVEKLNSGEDFATVAREYSEDPTAKAGGELGFVKKSQIAREFVDALEGMKPGDISQPFWTDRGVHIIKLEEVRSVREDLLEERFQKEYRSWLRGLREKSFIEIRL